MTHPSRVLVLLLLLVCGHAVLSEGHQISLPAGESAIENGSFNATGNRLASWLLRSGGYGSFTLTAPQTGSPDPVLTIKVRKADPKPWMMELRQQVAKVVEKGCTMYITFEYKMSKGYSYQFYWQEERPPWPKLLSMRLTSPTNAWHRIRVAAPVHTTYQPEETAFSFHLAEAPGVLEIRNFYAVMVPNDYDPESLETNETAVLGGDFYDREWREKVTERMMRTRSVPLKVQVRKLRKGGQRSRNHPPATGAVVLMKQQSRPFKLGVCVTSPLMYPDALSRPEYSSLRARLGSLSGSVQAYRSQILGNPLFSWVWSLDSFGWGSHASWGKSLSSQLGKDVVSAGQSYGGGYLYDPLFSSFPSSCRGQSRSELNQGLLNHIRGAVGPVAGTVSSWAVLHDAIAHSEVYNYIGVDSLAQAFSVTRESDREASLLLSDSNALSGISEIPLQDMIELVTWLRESAGVPVDGLLLGACMRRLDVGPQTLEKRLDMISSRLPGLPIHISDLSVNMSKEDLQGEMLRDYLLLFYSQPQVRSVSLGELWSPAAPMASLGYLHDDFTPKRSYEMVKKLFSEEWVSTAELKTDADGTATCTLLGGRYEVMVAFETMTKRFTVDIPEGHQLSAKQVLMKENGVILRYHPRQGLELIVFLNPWRKKTADVKAKKP